MTNKRQRDSKRVSEKEEEKPLEPVNDEPDTSAELLISKSLVGEPQGIVAIALSEDETLLVVARTTGSLQLFKVYLIGGVFHFVLLAHTGGQSNVTITGLCWGPGDTTIFASLLSGQIVAFETSFLQPIGVTHRSGGAIRAMCTVCESIFCALSDGSWRQYIHTGDGSLELLNVVARLADSSRALTVHGSTNPAVVVGTDDVGNVVAWKYSPKRSTGNERLWNLNLTNGFGVSAQVLSENGSIAVGTTMGEVVFIDISAGVIVNTFRHHKGPVTCLTHNAGRLYASGWHELLRCYKNENGMWFPAETKRRTHYHEATALAAGSKSGLFLSASRDGTVMFSNLHKLFTNPASYIDCSGQQFCYGSKILAHNCGKAIEAFAANDTDTVWLPLFRYQMQSKQNIKGMWCNDAFTVLAAATDTRLVFLSVERKGMQVSLKTIVNIEIPSVQDVVISGSYAYAAAPEAIVQVDIEANRHYVTPIAFSARRVLVEGTQLVVAGDSIQQSFDISDGVADINTPSSKSSEMMNFASVDGAVVGQADNGLFHRVVGEQDRSKSCVAPVDTTLIGQRGKFFFGHFARGLISSTRGSKAWTLVRRATVKAAYQRDDGQLVLLERNLEETLNHLPPMWKVRRFGN